MLWQRRLNVDILVHGHTNRSDIAELEGRYLLNPGSATGAFDVGDSISGDRSVPSFMLLSLSGNNALLYSYIWEENELQVSCSEFQKPVVEIST